MSCTKCWAYKWDCEDYCLIIGYDIQHIDIESRSEFTCEDMKRYVKWNNSTEFWQNIKYQ